MPRAFELRFRVTRGEYEHILSDSRMKGYRTMASYFRHRVFGETFILERKIVENNKILKRLEAHFFKDVPKINYTKTSSKIDIEEPEL